MKILHALDATNFSKEQLDYPAILSHLSKQEDFIVTFGAYGRSNFSQFSKMNKGDNMLNR